MSTPTDQQKQQLRVELTAIRMWIKGVLSLLDKPGTEAYPQARAVMRSFLQAALLDEDKMFDTFCRGVLEERKETVS